ncbi:MAG TPA: hypothetical protein VHA56_07610 [Mucilaginibacter sp.]|nr:hypothetical protein [Mucilaginibacter sp.]
MLIIVSAKSQSTKWEPGRFTDNKGNTESGYIRVNPSSKGPVRDEGFIEFRDNKKSHSFKLSASELKSFVQDRDSFVVAHPPYGEEWGKKELDFVQVEIDGFLKLYVSGGGGSGRGGSGIGFSPGIGIGAGSYGGGVSAGVSVPIFGGGRSGGKSEKTAYYYGENTAAMKRLTDENFEDVMSDIMGDEPEVVDKIHAKVYVLANIERLINYFNQVKMNRASGQRK